MTQATNPTPLASGKTAVDFWNDRFHNHKLQVIDPQEYRFRAGAIFGTMLDTFGQVQGKRILEIGCGRGDFAIYLAKQGAHVTAVDNAEQATSHTRAMAEYNGVSNAVNAVTIDAGSLASLGQTFDWVTGRFILHHIEPFDRFAEVIAAILKPQGRGVFLENNARNPLLMFCRRYLAGRFGIPKYGDDEEYPFEPRELAILREKLGKAEASFPQLVFLRKLNTYVFRHKPAFRPLCRTLDGLDNLLYTAVPVLRKCSYNQIITLQQTRTTA